MYISIMVIISTDDLLPRLRYLARNITDYDQFATYEQIVVKCKSKY